MTRQIVSFLTVGGLGFLVDAGITQALVSFAGVPQLSARVPAILIAVCLTFYFNKNHTFDAKDTCLAKSFGLYAISTVVAQSINFAAYTAAVMWVDMSHHFTFLAVAFGSVCGAAITFLLSKYWVFKA